MYQQKTCLYNSALLASVFAINIRFHTYKVFQLLSKRKFEAVLFFEADYAIDATKNFKKKKYKQILQMLCSVIQ